MSSAVVLLIYRRPELTRQVVERVFAAKPGLLLVVADGPGDESERDLCEQARNVIRQFSWPCEVRWQVAESNLGLRQRISSGLDWVFSQVERAIVLEDDCLPELSFFEFCETMLSRYADDERIMEIAGSSLTAGSFQLAASYYFSKYYHPWGWATWRRAWQHYDEAIAAWPEIRKNGIFPFDDWMEKRFWTRVFDRIYERDLNTWDYQWLFTMWSQSGLSIVPATNLVTNIGFGPGGTHYTSDHRFAHLKAGSLGTIVHPDKVIRNQALDRAEFRAAGNRFERLARVELGRLRWRLYRLRNRR